ncbi:MAG: DEAD/DEAH box helicase [Alphaproteobacteria bacterium]|nr:DEAD/DEAH box helicase [Alphaproteobacteria bacterium]
MIKLRDYQEEVITGCRTAYSQGKKAPLLVLPTGAGKTICFSYVAQSASSRGSRVLILVHRQELIYQTSEKLKMFGVDHGIISPEFPHTDKPVQVAMIQTLVRRTSKITKPDLIVVDEAHHAMSSTYTKIIEWGGCRILGVTATPCRLDGRGLGNVFDEIVVGVTVKKLIEMGHLSPYKYYSMPIKIENKLHKRMGDYKKDEVDEVAKKAIAGDIVGEWEKRALNEPTIVFCPSVDASERVAKLFQDRGYKFESLSGNMKREHRKGLISGLANGSLTGITSCDVVSEGTDIPVASCAILIRKTASTSLFLQQVGRVLRPVEGKIATIIDMVSNFSDHGAPCEEREWDLSTDKKKKKTKDKNESFNQCDECFCIFSKDDDECPECGWEVPEKVAAEISFDSSYTLQEVDFSSPRNKGNFQKKFGEFCQTVKGYKKGMAYHKYKEWNSLGCNPDEASSASWALLYSQTDKQLSFDTFVNWNKKLWKEFLQWQKQKMQSSTK